MEKHFFFISLRRLYSDSDICLLIGNTQPSYAMLGDDQGVAGYAEQHESRDESSAQTEKQ